MTKQLEYFLAMIRSTEIKFENLSTKTKLNELSWWTGGIRNGKYKIFKSQRICLRRYKDRLSTHNVKMKIILTTSLPLEQ